MAITQKLLAFQEKNITVEKDKINPHFKNRYTTLDEVLSKVREPLQEMGVLILQTPQENGLMTTLIDTEDGSEVQGLMPWAGADNPQKILSCTTYYRRGSLVSMLNLEAEDDDGNVASAPSHKKAKAVEEELEF